MIGTKLAHYEIISHLGSGGMGEVYQATDSKLGRSVAIKFLPEAFSHDNERVARFEREARVLASLNHPNIAAIFGLEESGNRKFLVMELVGGETLAERIKRGSIPVEESLGIAKQICEALEAAHEKGIVHRDLKPANVKITPDGKVKVLDFGLAKAFEPETSKANLSQSPTPSMAVTNAGLILGTPAYMSPEQTRGITVDRRTDIFSFGAVFYEMLTGGQVFRGEAVSDVLAAVLKEEPDWKRLPPDTPDSIRRLLRRCLTKNHTLRLADIADAMIEINEASGEPAKISNVAPDRRHGVRWTTLTAALLLAAIAIGVTDLVQRVRSRQQESPSRAMMRLELSLPAGVELFTGGASVALSPDGTRVAFIGVLGGSRQIFVRRLDQPEATPLLRAMDNHVISCFFSPNGSALGFITTDNLLKKVSLENGLVNPLATDVDIRAGGAWGADDRITFGKAGTLWQIPARGGAAKQLTQLDQGKGELSHRTPTVVADGRALLFTVVTGSDRRAVHIEALSLATGQRQVLVDQAAISLYAPSGHLIFFRDSALLAASFDVNRLVVTGQPVRVVEDLALDSAGTPIVALSSSGALLYPSSVQATSKLVWVSRQGLEQPITSIPRSYQNPRISPDGRLVLVTANGDLWVQDTIRMTFIRLTSDATAGNSFAVWTPDGKRVVFRTPSGIQWIDTDGSGRSQAIPDTGINDYPSSVAPDGSALAFVRVSADKSADVYVLSLRGEAKPHPVVTTPAYEGGPQFSPDGHWLAYASDESGEFQVYVRPFPGPDRRWPVSTQGGRHVRWNRNGHELFYRNGNKMMVVDVSTHPELVLSSPRLLFEQRYAFGISVTTPNYDVSPDGERFVMVKDDSGSGRLNLVLNWFEELKQRVPVQ
jgi:Tol biopolymer transport system component